MTIEEECQEILEQIDKLHDRVSKFMLDTLNKEERVKMNVKDKLSNIMKDNDKIFKELAEQ